MKRGTRHYLSDGILAKKGRNGSTVPPFMRSLRTVEAVGGGRVKSFFLKIALSRIFPERSKWLFVPVMFSVLITRAVTRLSKVVYGKA